LRLITPGYFDAIGVPLVAGRWLDRAEFEQGSAVVVINETLARQLFAGEDPLGRRIQPGFPERGLEVVGVTGDVAGGWPDRPAPPAFYVPLETALAIWASEPRSANQRWFMSALVRTTGDPHDVVPALRGAVAAVDADLPIYSLRTLADLADARLGVRRFAMSLFGVFAGLALLLGAVGIYGVMSYTVAQRRRELGMRIALGAGRSSVLRMVLAQGARLAAPGIVLGLAVALVASRLLTGLLYEVSPLDPWTYAAVAVVLATVSMFASGLPAWRAARVDPAVSLRGD
jgi:predicted permease